MAQEESKPEFHFHLICWLQNLDFVRTEEKENKKYIKLSDKHLLNEEAKPDM